MAMLMAFLAGFVYIIVPGPVFLALVRTVAERDHRDGYKLISGSIIGDLFWVTLALGSLIYSYALNQNIFRILAAACGSYLIYLGLSTFKRKELSATKLEKNKRSPFLIGLTLGFLNPKSYPVLLATIAGFLNGYVGTSPLVLAPSICLGIITAYACMIAICSIGYIKMTYIRYASVIVRAIGIAFCIFGFGLLRSVYIEVTKTT